MKQGHDHLCQREMPRECVGDRAALPHDASLFDINSKYGDVVSVDDVLEKL